MVDIKYIITVVFFIDEMFAIDTFLADQLQYKLLRAHKIGLHK